jgi:hypothetical protein
MNGLIEQFCARLQSGGYSPLVKQQGAFLLLALKQCGPGREAERKAALYHLDKFTAALRAA